MNYAEAIIDGYNAIAGAIVAVLSPHIRRALDLICSLFAT